MSTEWILPVVSEESHSVKTDSSCRTKQLAAVALNEVGNKLYSTGQQDDAIVMFHAASQALLSETDSSLSQKLHWGCHRIGTQQSQQTNLVDFQQHPPDIYLEGECDVGPRPLRAPLHIDACAATDDFLLQAIVSFNVALVHHSKSEFDEAMEHYSLSLEALSKSPAQASVSMMSHVGMLVHNNMGQISYIEDDGENSILHFEAAVFWAKQTCGDNGLLLATVLSNYCRSQWIHGNVDEDTHRAFETVFRLRTSALPPDHVDVACAHYNMGVMAYARGFSAEAKKHFHQYMAMAMKNKELDPVPAMAFILLIDNEDKDDKLSSELVQALYTLQERREEYGAVHMEVAALLNYIGTLLFHRKELHLAILFYRAELRLEKVLMNVEAGISISVTYNNIGRILQELGELPEAIGCYQSALKADIDDSSYVHAAAFAAGNAEFTLPGNVEMSPSTTNLFSTIWYNLGLIHDKMGARREAIMAFQMALGLRRQMLGEDHPDIACLWYNIGTLQMESRKFDDASASFQETLRIRRLGRSPDDSRHVLTTLKKLVSLQQSLGHIQDALASYHEILHIQESSDFDLQWKTPGAIGMTLRKIADLYEAKGDLKAALASAERSYVAFKSSGAFLQHNAVDHLKAVEEVAKSLIVLGSLYNEACEPMRAQSAHAEASLVIGAAIHRMGASAHAALRPLLEACTIQSASCCAPVA